MSVFPQFLQHIHNQGLYVPGYNYEEMYNIMVETIMTDTISTNNFIYSYNQVNDLYELLYELLYPLPNLIDTETNTIPNMYQIQVNQNINTMNTNVTHVNADTDDTDDIYTANTYNETNNINHNTQILVNNYMNTIHIINNLDNLDNIDNIDNGNNVNIYNYNLNPNEPNYMT